MQDPHADQLQRQMASVRGDLEHSSTRLKENAQTLADWRYHVRRHPWICLTVAGAAGFLAVPKRAKAMTPTPENLAELARQHGLVVQPRPETARSSGLLSGLAATMARTLLRTAATFATQQIGQAFARRTAAAAQGQSGNHPPVGLPR